MFAVVLRYQSEEIRNYIITKYSLIYNIMNLIKVENNAGIIKNLLNLLELTFIREYQGVDMMESDEVDLSNINL